MQAWHSVRLSVSLTLDDFDHSHWTKTDLSVCQCYTFGRRDHLSLGELTRKSPNENSLTSFSRDSPASSFCLTTF